MRPAPRHSHSIIENAPIMEQNPALQQCYGALLLLTMFHTAMLYVAMAATLDGLAAKVQLQVTNVEEAHLVRFLIGALGSVAAIYVYQPACFLSNAAVLKIILIAQVCLCVGVSFVVSKQLLYFEVGVFSALCDLSNCGIRILLRKIFRGDAGPWVSAAGASLTIGGTAVTLLYWARSSSLVITYFVIAAAGAAATIGMVTSGLVEPPEPTAGASPGPKVAKSRTNPEGHLQDLLSGCLLLCTIGVQQTITAFGSSYTAAQKLADEATSRLLLFGFWGILCVMNVFFIFVARKNVPTASLYNWLTCSNVLASMLSIAAALQNEPGKQTWRMAAIFVVYPLLTGSNVSIAFLLHDRLTKISEFGMALLVFVGIITSGSLVPYFTHYVWIWSGSTGRALPVIIALCNGMAVVLLWATSVFAQRERVQLRWCHYAAATQHEHPNPLAGQGPAGGGASTGAVAL